MARQLPRLTQGLHARAGDGWVYCPGRSAWLDNPQGQITRDSEGNRPSHHDAASDTSSSTSLRALTCGLVEQYVHGKCLPQMSRAPRILVIDDDRADRRLFERTLSQDGYYVACAKSGREALVLTRTTAFDLVVLDLSLGDMDGFRLLNEIRTESPLARVLVVSGVMKSFLHGIVRDAGAHAALAKPISPLNLREAVYQLLDPTCSWQGQRPDA